MKYILFLALALVLAWCSAERTIPRKPRQWKLKPRVGLTSSEMIAQLISQLAKGDNQHGVDMDYFGDSGERIVHSERNEDRRSQLEDPYFSNDRVRLVYVSNPEVLEEYKKKIKKIRVERGSSESETEEGGVSYRDILQFLVQVDARLRERDGRPKNVVPIMSPPKLNRILQNLRRSIDEASEEANDEAKEIAPRLHNMPGGKGNNNHKGYTFPVRDKSSESKRIYDSVENVREKKRGREEREKQKSAEKSWKKFDIELPTTTEKFWKKPDQRSPLKRGYSWKPNKMGQFRPKPDHNGRVPMFISTPIPLRGGGVYEDDK